MADLAWILLYAVIGLVVGWRVVSCVAAFRDVATLLDELDELDEYAVAWPLVVAWWAVAVVGGAVRR